MFAGVLPEGKSDLVKAFQEGWSPVGMCGDGANDAPALRQAQMGIAVSMATNVAKWAAGIVLTQPGLGGIVASVKEGILIAATLAIGGIFMTPLPVLVVAGMLAAAVVLRFVVYAAKGQVFGGLGIASITTQTCQDPGKQHG